MSTSPIESGASRPSAGLDRLFPANASATSTAPAFDAAFDKARQSAFINGRLDYRIETNGIDDRIIGRVLQTAAQDGSLNLKASPQSLDALTASKAGTRIESYAKSLGIDTKDKNVGQLIEAIGVTSLGRAGADAFNALPGDVRTELGIAALALIVGSGKYGSLAALGIGAEAKFQGGKLSIKLSGTDGGGPRLDFEGEATVRDGDASLKAKGRVSTQGNVAAGVSIETKGRDLRLSASAAASNFPGEPQLEASAVLGLSLGRALLTGSIDFKQDGGSGKTTYGAGLSGPVFGLNGELNLNITPTETRVTGTVRFGI